MAAHSGDAGAALGARLRGGDRSAAPAALNLLETRTARDQSAALVTTAGQGDGHIVGVTGPPGVGKSTLLSALVREWRARDRSVAVLAVVRSPALHEVEHGRRGGQVAVAEAAAERLAGAHALAATPWRSATSATMSFMIAVRSKSLGV